MESPSEHELQTLRLLGAFQVLELTLKLYISAAYAVVKNSLNDAVPFRYTYKDVEGVPLGKLLKIFAKLNANAPLQARLKKLTDKRNDVAHRALLYRHDVICELLELDVGAHAVDLASTEQELDACLVLMAQELERVVSVHDGNLA